MRGAAGEPAFAAAHSAQNREFYLGNGLPATTVVDVPRAKRPSQRARPQILRRRLAARATAAEPECCDVTQKQRGGNYPHIRSCEVRRIGTEVMRRASHAPEWYLHPGEPMVAWGPSWRNGFGERNVARTDLIDLLGILHPIIQAPMIGFSGPALVAAVSNAGALGSLPCAAIRHRPRGSKSKSYVEPEPAVQPVTFSCTCS